MLASRPAEALSSKLGIPDVRCRGPENRCPSFQRHEGQTRHCQKGRRRAGLHLRESNDEGRDDEPPHRSILARGAARRLGDSAPILRRLGDDLVQKHQRARSCVASRHRSGSLERCPRFPDARESAAMVIHERWREAWPASVRVRAVEERGRTGTPRATESTLVTSNFHSKSLPLEARSGAGAGSVF
jgi:hypothetical protein